VLSKCNIDALNAWTFAFQGSFLMRILQERVLVICKWRDAEDVCVRVGGSGEGGGGEDRRSARMN
jgi:hypothetical protein